MSFKEKKAYNNLDVSQKNVEASTPNVEASNQNVEASNQNVEASNTTPSDDDYTIVEIKKLGQGTFGKVIVGVVVLKTDSLEIIEEKKKGPFFVVKSIHRSNLPDIVRETRVLKHLQGKSKRSCTEKNILCFNTYLYNNTNETYHLLFNYDDGYVDLRSFIDKKKEIPMHELYFIFNNIYKNIKYIHHKGIAHCDIKPANILISTKDYKTKLIDFGLSCINGNEQNIKEVHCSNNIIGTPYYFDIRFFRCVQSSSCNINFEKQKKKDLWAFGVMIYDIMCHEKPFDKDHFIKKLSNMPNYSDEDDENILYLLQIQQYYELFYELKPLPIENFEKGTKVMVDHQKGVWFNGEIETINDDGTYDIFYPKLNQKKEKVISSLIQPFIVIVNVLPKDSIVFAKRKDRSPNMWFPGKVLKYTKYFPTYTIQYDEDNVEEDVKSVNVAENLKENFINSLKKIKENFNAINQNFKGFYKDPQKVQIPDIEDFFKPYELEAQPGGERKNKSRKNKSRKNKSRKNKSRKKHF